MFQKKKKEEDSPGLKIALMHWYTNSKNTLKSTEEDWLQQPETVWTTQVSTEQKQPGNKMKEKQLWIFQAINKRNFTWENLDMAKKGKP